MQGEKKHVERVDDGEEERRREEREGESEGGKREELVCLFGWCPSVPLPR